MVTTYPVIGNYGFPSEDKDPKTGLTKFLESDNIHPAALIMHDYTDEYSHWNAVESLDSALARHGVVGLTGIDTRELTIKLRNSGPRLCKVLLDEVRKDNSEFISTDEINLVDKVSTKEVKEFTSFGSKKVVLVDCGVKENIIRHLIKRGLNVTLVPWDYDFSQLQYDGLFISNGPGNPLLCTTLVERVRDILNKGDEPVAGICIDVYKRQQPSICSP